MQSTIFYSGSEALFAATCEYSIVNQWDSGFTAEILILNDTPNAIQDWSVTLSYADGSSITQTWNATLTSQNPYIASSLSNIPANGSATFGFNGPKAIPGADAQIPQLSGVCSSQFSSNDLVYALDTQNSSVYLVSSKKTNTLETHHFTNINGSISDGGEANLSIDLNSIESGIELRNERMRDLLFEIDSHRYALVSLPVNLATLSAQSIGNSSKQRISATLSLHGVERVIDTDVIITKLTNSKILVQNASPILISAADYNLSAGIEQLRSIANLAKISYTVPVNFTLLFDVVGSR